MISTKRGILFVAMLMTWLQGYGQQDLQVSHYMFNHLLLNPGYAGSKDYMMATLLYRKQWVNFDGAPESQVASIHGPLSLTNFGWGAIISHDKIGVTNRTDIYANGAYHLRVGAKTKLGLGIRAGGGYYTYKNSDLKYWDQQDPNFMTDKVSRFLPNIGAGVYLYGKKYYAGISVPEIISYDSTKSLSMNLDGEVVPQQVRHYFATAGYAFELSSEVVLRPSVMVKFVDNAPVIADFNVNVLLSNFLWIGASYRTNDAVVGLVEFQLSRKLRIGYSYDYTLTDIQNYSSGSHEFMLGYDFGYDIMKMKTPRYF